MFKSINDVVPEHFYYIQQFYDNAFTKEKKPIFIRQGTAISQSRNEDFPSPRIGGGNKDGINFCIMPNFSEDKYGNRIDYDNYY